MDRRRRRGFETVGKLEWERLGLPRARARELRLAHAWRRIAGPALARRVTALRVQRGILDLRLTDRGDEWSGTVADLLPDVAGRLAAACPDLGIRRCRLRTCDDEVLCSVEVEPVEPPPSRSASRPAVPGKGPESAADEDRGRQLARVMERYLARRGDRSG